MWQDARSSEAVVKRCSVQKGVLTNFAKFTGKHLRQSLFLIKLQVVVIFPVRISLADVINMIRCSFRVKKSSA